MWGAQRLCALQHGKLMLIMMLLLMLVLMLLLMLVLKLVLMLMLLLMFVVQQNGKLRFMLCCVATW